MEILKIDKTKCFTPKNYSKKYHVPLTTVYDQMKKKKLRTEKIDGVEFVYLG